MIKFKLDEWHNKKTGKKSYVVTLHDSRSWRTPYDEIRQHFDPHKNRQVRGGGRWRFSSKKVAEQLLVIAIMKWGT